MPATGRLAQAILADQQAHGGLLTAADLACHEARQLPSIRLPYREFELLLPPPSSTGGVLTAFTMKLLSGFNVRQYRHGSAVHLQLLYEVMAATTRVRAHWDRDSEALPVEEALAHFLSDDFVARYHTEVEAAIYDKTPSTHLTEPKSANNTSHLSVIDGDGLAVSLTTTAGESAGMWCPARATSPTTCSARRTCTPTASTPAPPGSACPP
ncbi:MAG: gamma-glutamyltransferase [Ardenticatenaceae bacterium]|nr:gamma-glutamyltransferase [Ardenticatenaceae bacterium]